MEFCILSTATKQEEDKINMATLIRELFLMAILCCYCCWCQRRNCTIWEARRYRDCTCGVQYLDYEEHCQDDFTYFETTLHQDTLQCDFKCQHGGTLYVLDPVFEVYYCDCYLSGRYGGCCEKGNAVSRYIALTGDQYSRH